MKISKNNWLLIFSVILLVALILGISYGSNMPNESTTPIISVSQEVNTQVASFNEDGTVVSYNGVEGETALATLKSITTVRTEQSSFGEFVTGIGEADSDSSKNFWGFYVNGTMANVGAGEYIASEGDQIEWQLEELN